VLLSDLVCALGDEAVLLVSLEVVELLGAERSLGCAHLKLPPCGLIALTVPLAVQVFKC